MFRTYVSVLLGWAAFASPALAQPATTVWFGVPGVQTEADAPSTQPAPTESDAPMESAAAPATTSNESSPRAARDPAAASTCPGPVHLVRRMGDAPEHLREALLDCAGHPRPAARRQLALLMRPRQDRVPPSQEAIEAWQAHDGDPAFLSPRVRLPHPALMTRLQRLSDALGGAALEVLSGFRPHTPRSRHGLGRAVDLRANDLDALHAVALGLSASGVGWDPEHRFLHLDVRPSASYWETSAQDASREPPVATATAAPPEGNAAEAPDVADALSDLQRAMGSVVLPSAP
ncbi:MAG: hypothetical protein AB8I08_07675 [Sandaracinaceae bacterium]